jgi:hypothetical protein
MCVAQVKDGTYMTMDVIDYIDFLFTQPLHERVDRQRIDDNAHAVARTLVQVADSTGFHEIRQLATRILLLDLQMGVGNVAPPKVVLKFLQVHEQRLPCTQYKIARSALKNFKPRPKRHAFTHVEYRGRGGAEYYWVGSKKRWPQNDLTFRLVDAYWALKNAGWPQPVAFLARRLNELAETDLIGIPETKWTSNKIESRIKPHKKLEKPWIHFPWRERYWLYLNRGKLEKTRRSTEQPFEFSRVGACSPASRSENKRPTPAQGVEASSLPPWI